jgi:hypothetical protein
MAPGDVPAERWQAYGEAHAREIRECAEVSFVPAEKSEHKDTQPLRYVAIRIRQRQEAIFDDGSKVKHFAVVTNIREWKAGRLIQWHREKAGTVEGVHDVVKNELAGGGMPCKYFGANAAWLRLAVISHNVMTALKRLALPAELLTARPKRLRFLIFNTPGRLVHPARRTVLRLATTAQRSMEWLEAARPAARLRLNQGNPRPFSLSTDLHALFPANRSKSASGGQPTHGKTRRVTAI